MPDEPDELRPSVSREEYRVLHTDGMRESVILATFDPVKARQSLRLCRMAWSIVAVRLEQRTVVTTMGPWRLTWQTEAGKQTVPAP